jgi:hypothetical protein
VVVELVKEHGIRFNFLPPFFLMITGSNLLAVVVCELDATKKRLYQLARADLKGAPWGRVPLVKKKKSSKNQAKKKKKKTGIDPR